MAKEPPETVFRIAKRADMDAEQDLDARAVSPNGMSADLKRKWLEANNESDYHVYHNNKLVAFLFLIPIRKDIIEPFIQSSIHWKDIDPQKDIEKYEPGKAVDVFVQGIASDPDADETMRTHYMLVLIRGAGDELKKLGRRGVIINKIYARSQTPTGIAMALHIGMSAYEPLPKTGKLLRFILDVDKSNTYLARKYKEGLKEWRKEQGG